jgi:hypothetical protein
MQRRRRMNKKEKAAAPFSRRKKQNETKRASGAQKSSLAEKKKKNDATSTAPLPLLLSCLLLFISVSLSSPVPLGRYAHHELTMRASDIGEVALKTMEDAVHPSCRCVIVISSFFPFPFAITFYRYNLTSVSCFSRLSKNLTRPRRLQRVVAAGIIFYMSLIYPFHYYFACCTLESNLLPPALVHARRA